MLASKSNAQRLNLKGGYALSHRGKKSSRTWRKKRARSPVTQGDHTGVLWLKKVNIWHDSTNMIYDDICIFVFSNPRTFTASVWRLNPIVLWRPSNRDQRIGVHDPSDGLTEPIPKDNSTVPTLYKRPKVLARQPGHRLHNFMQPFVASARLSSTCWQNRGALVETIDERQVELSGILKQQQDQGLPLWDLPLNKNM